MSCGCESVEICISGKTYFADIVRDIRGYFVSGSYLDTNLTKQPLNPGTFSFGACPVTVSSADTRRFVQLLVAGNNVINHGLIAAQVGTGYSTEVEVRNNTTGALISALVTVETASSVTINVPVAVASARITIDV